MTRGETSMIKGNAAIVTGSTSGIGLGIATALAGEGCNLLLNGFGDGKVAYVSAKHGLVGMTKVVALDHANDGITCNAICPGWVLTPLVQKQIEDHAKEQGIAVAKAKENLLKDKQPMLQFSTPEHLG